MPAKDNMAMTVEARTQAVAGKDVTVGRRAHTVRHGQGRPAWTERLKTEVVGIAGLMTEAQYDTPEHVPCTQSLVRPNDEPSSA